MNRNRILLVVLIAGAAILLFLPIGRRHQANRGLPSADSAVIRPLEAYIASHYQSPKDYVVSTFAHHSVVFLGEYGRIRQNVQLVGQLIPALYRHGVHNLAIEYALSSDQSLIDRLTTSATYDPKLADKILFDYLVIWGYQGYADLFKAAWSFNRQLPKGAPPFRIVGLSTPEKWQYIQKRKDATDPAVLHKVFSNGIPDVHMASIIEKEILATGEKALVYVKTPSAFTRYRSPQYAANMKKMGFADRERAGNLIYDRIGDKSFTILFHQPWPEAKARGGATYPLGGTIDNLIAQLPPDRRDAGFTVRGTVFGKLKLSHSDFAVGKPVVTFGELCDGYIIQGKLSGYQPVAAIPDFVTSENIATAIRLFPGPKVPNLTPKDLNQYITRNLSSLGQSFSQFQ